ncbi:ATP-binding protein [Gilvimarinus sp. F26214L]|uniref:ATP-binding protein n=1 Tax=Gilvimarinus sp. DZF01 TaxID=3461371 RepID=UPI004045A27B
MPESFPGIAAPRENLRRLLIIRWVLVLCLLAGSAFAYWGFSLSLPYRSVSAVLLAIVLFNLATEWRLRKRWPVTHQEFFLQILLDIVGVTVLFYHSGGASNPFVFYYLVPLSISAATLPWRFTWALALLSVVSYTLLLFYNVPIPGISPVAGEHVHGQETASPLNPHILGMWFNFIISAGLITFFVVTMSNALKSQQQQLNEYREENLRDEQVLAVATLAAGTAHELGSPLTTMKLLINEMAHDYAGNEALDSDLRVLTRQVDLCSNTLQDLARRAEVNRASSVRACSVGEYCQHLIERWQLLRPDVRAEVSIQEQARDRQVAFHSTVEQAIINLLNNAADAASEKVQVNMGWNSTDFRVEIIDDGPGIPAAVKQQLGQSFVTTKGKGLGLGLFLSNATLSRYGGRMILQDNRPTGTKLTISLPITYHEQA